MHKINRICFFFVFLSLCLCLNAQEMWYEPGMVRIKLQREMAETVSKEIGRQGMFRSGSEGYVQLGLTSVDAGLRNARATGLKRMIPYNAKYDARHKAKGLDLWFELEIDSEVLEAVKELSSQQGFLLVEPVPIIKRTAVEDDYPVNDAYIARQWYLNNTGKNPIKGGTPAGVAGTDIRAYEAWQVVTGSPNVVVAVLDGGIDITHPDLQPNLWINEAELNGTTNVDDDGNGYIDDIHGYDFVNDRLTIQAHPHGSHVGGLVAAKGNNEIGIAGIAGGTTDEDGVRLMVCQIFDNNDRTRNTPAAFIYAADNGAVIAQCSWTSVVAGIKDQAALDAIDYFIEYAGKDENGNPLPGTPMAGGLVVFAAGNNGVDNMAFYPPAYEKCFAVASIDIDNKKAPYSNSGSWVNISAPGGYDQSACGEFGQMFSTLPGGYGYMYGTSMACPLVSGTAALVLSKYGNENYTPEMLKNRLLITASDTYGQDPDYAGRIGIGMLDAYAAVSADIPDINANLYFGEFPMDRNSDGTIKSHEQPIRIMNLGEEELIILGYSSSSNDFEITDFEPGKKLGSGEYTEFTVKFTPSEVKEYQETLTMSYGGAFDGQFSTTLLAANVQASTQKVSVFFDDFEGGTYGWTFVDEDGDGRNWVWQNNTNSFVLAHSGDFFMVSETKDSKGNIFTPDNWMITPEIDLSEIPEDVDVLLTYWVRVISSLYEGEHYYVRVSTSPEKDFSASDFSRTLISEDVYPGSYNDGYNYRQLSLNEFIGQKIKIAFVHADPVDGFWLVLDDVEVAIYPEDSFIEIQMEPDFPMGYELVRGETYDLQVKVSNNGNIPAQDVEVTYRWEESGESVTEIIPYIAAGETLVYTFRHKLTAPEEPYVTYEFSVTVNCEGDLLATNNTLQVAIWVNPYYGLYEWGFEGAAYPNECYRFTFDDNVVSYYLSQTSWGVDWPPNSSTIPNRELFILFSAGRFGLDPALQDYSAISCSYFFPEGKADRWMVFAVPEIETEELILKWTALSSDAKTPEDYEVLISKRATITENPDNPNKPDLEINPQDFTVLETIRGENGILTNRTSNLTEYAGEPFYLAFRHITEQGMVLILDNIKLLTPEALPHSVNDKNTIQENKVIIYPNPVKSYMSIEADSEIEKVEILDLTGRLIYISPLVSNSNMFTLDGIDYPSGLYLVKIKTEKGSNIQKVYITQ